MIDIWVLIVAGILFFLLSFLVDWMDVKAYNGITFSDYVWCAVNSVCTRHHWPKYEGHCRFCRMERNMRAQAKTQEFDNHLEEIRTKYGRRDSD